MALCCFNEMFLTGETTWTTSSPQYHLPLLLLCFFLTLPLCHKAVIEKNKVAKRIKKFLSHDNFFFPNMEVSPRRTKVTRQPPALLQNQPCSLKAGPDDLTWHSVAGRFLPSDAPSDRRLWQRPAR